MNMNSLDPSATWAGSEDWKSVPSTFLANLMSLGVILHLDKKRFPSNWNLTSKHEEETNENHILIGPLQLRLHW